MAENVVVPITPSVTAGSVFVTMDGQGSAVIATPRKTSATLRTANCSALATVTVNVATANVTLASQATFASPGRVRIQPSVSFMSPVCGVS